MAGSRDAAAASCGSRKYFANAVRRAPRKDKWTPATGTDDAPADKRSARSFRQTIPCGNALLRVSDKGKAGGAIGMLMGGRNGHVGNRRILA
ncbi:hypothetical protein SAMN05216551_11873 [Chitinasiproducens palmae]|uniref:Uncharacterized protein n=1 Tax=Chitinasiproducens palmae TaxID=1770053 RepID=A0A1H2PW55_9BURK|nr:hypothetical protein SAMN05216551_11873 [Chitinasiproducens palmae]